MYKVLILTLAKEDIKEAAIWYNKQQVGLGNRFTSEVRKKVNYIRQNPKAIHVRYNNVRTAVLDVFPFMIHYMIDEEKTTIIISAVLHTSRNPNLWNKR